MRIVIDTNVIIAALLKDSTVRKLLLERENEFFMPEYALTEIRKYKHEIIARAAVSESSMELVLAAMLRNVQLIPDHHLRRHMLHAEDIMKSIDTHDSPFIAACLAVHADGILTFDNHFRQQQVVRVLSIEEL